jgi:hypothetical protein
MSAPTAPQPSHPRLVLRVGITGARSILPEHEARVSEQIAAVLRLTRQEVACLARMTEAKQAYQTDADDKVVPAFRFISPLAEGADRLAARTAHAQCWALAVPMPFHREDYEWDFKTKESFDEFRMMLSWAGGDTLELDGARDDPANDRYDEARSYEAVGRLIVRNCDLLIAIWDGKPGRGRGGTADTMQFAAESGPPVWWIHAERDTPPVWIEDTRDLRPAAPRRNAPQALRDHLERLILPPKFAPKPEERHSFVEWIARLGQQPVVPLDMYYAEQPLLRSDWSSVNDKLIRWAGGDRDSGQESPPPDDPVAHTWHDAYCVPNQLAADYAARYRSTYVWVFALAAFALAFAALSLCASGLQATTDWLTIDTSHCLKLLATAAELAALIAILCFVIANIRHDWHPRWIDYRLLAELYREQQALAVLGWSLSGRAVQALVAQREDRAAWLIWLFAAMLRAAPMLQGIFDPARCERARALIQRDLVEEQLHYHAGRQRQSDSAGRHFVRLGEALFFTVILVVLAKLVLLFRWNHLDGWIGVLGLFAAMLPAFAAASIGVRAYAELELLADQSRRMSAGMELGKKRIGAVCPARPLASQELGMEVLEVATLMLQDVDGWARLFRVKVVETG